MISSVDDLRCMLKFYTPTNEAERTKDLKLLQADLEEENAYRHRRPTVVKMLESKIRSIKKIKFK